MLPAWSVVARGLCYHNSSVFSSALPPNWLSLQSKPVSILSSVQRGIVISACNVANDASRHSGNFLCI